MKRASTGHPGNLGLQKPRIASNSVRCLSGYRAKGLRITGKRPGTHRAICCPAELVAAAYDERSIS